MRRTVTIGSCLAGLCLAALAVWMYMKYSGPGDVAVPLEDGSDGLTSNEPSVPTEKAAIPTEKAAMTPVVFELPTHVAFMGQHMGVNEYSSCFVDTEKMILYRWKGVILLDEQIQQTPYDGVISGIDVLDAKDFSVTSVEAPVKYRQTDGGYRLGYVDQTIRTFYAWKGVVLSKQQLLDKSQDGQPALLKPADPDDELSVLEIDMPPHLKDHPELWKKMP